MLSQNMVDPFGEPRGKFAYKAILERLQKINSILGCSLDDDEDMDEAAGDSAGFATEGATEN
jgi:hypothetical protein